MRKKSSDMHVVCLIKGEKKQHLTRIMCSPCQTTYELCDPKKKKEEDRTRS